MSTRSTEEAPAHPEAPVLRATVRLLQAIAHPTRLLVLSRLRDGPLAAGELQALAGVEQSAMSHQLRVLRDARLVTTERLGRRVVYRLHDHHVAQIVDDALTHVVERL